MARIRSIKPDFWTSDQVVECSRDARLLFIGIWNFADDGGVIPAKPKSIKMKVFPGEEDLTSDDVRRMLDELLESGLIVEFAADGHEYIHVTGWSDHQRIDRPTPKYPGPYDEGSVITLSRFNEPSASAHPRKGGEGIGEEGKGEDGALPDESASSADAPPAIPDDPVVERIPLNTGKPFDVTQSMVDRYAETYPAVDVPQALRTMRDWCDANPSKRKTRNGAKPFVSRWLSREQDRGGSPGGGNGPGGGSGGYSRNAGAAAQAKRELAEEFGDE